MYSSSCQYSLSLPAACLNGVRLYQAIFVVLLADPAICLQPSSSAQVENPQHTGRAGHMSEGGRQGFRLPEMDKMRQRGRGPTKKVRLA